MKFVAVVLITLFTLSACNTEEELTPIIGSVFLEDLLVNDTLKLLSVSVDSSWKTDNTNNWIFINDQEGKVIGFSPFESGDQLDIKAFIKQKPATFTVSLLEVNEPPTQFKLQSYIGIQRGMNWHVTRLVEHKRKPKGTLRITINNAPRPPANQYQVSDDFGSNPFEISYSLGRATIDCSWFEPISKIGISVYTYSNEIRYLEIDNPGLFDRFTFDFNDFTFPNHQTVLPLAPNNFVSATIRGLKDLKFDRKIDQKGIALTNVIKQEGTEKIYLGYVGGFPFYYTELNINTEFYQYHYEKLGQAPDFGKLSIPGQFPRIVDGGFSNFAISGADEYDHVQVTWKWPAQDVPGFAWNWIIHSDIINYPSGLEFPEEILSEYPEIDFDHGQMKLENARIIRNIDNYSYRDMIGELTKKNTEDYRPHEFSYFIMSD